MNEIALPFKYDYANVLSLVGTIAYSIYYFYLLWLVSSALISFYANYSRKSKMGESFSKRILSIPLKKINFVFALGILPALVILSLDYIWLVGEEFSTIHTLRIISFVLFTVSSISLFIYNNSFLSYNLKNELDEELRNFVNRIKLINRYSLWIGILGILLVVFLEAILYTAKLSYQSTNFRIDVFEYLIDYKVYLKVLNYFALGFSITFLANLFYYYLWEERDAELEFQEDYLHKFVDFSLISILVLPALILIDLFLLPQNSLSYWVFISSGISVILVFIIANELNAFKRENYGSLGRFAFYFTVLMVIILTSKDIVATANILKPKTVEISQNFVQYETELKNKLNIKTVVINGEEIFTAKCSACHRFDSKLVGPPYNIVLKKYENNREQLIKFILNPVKVDPQYPPMPSQGLIPPEAEAVADYIMKVYKENKTPLN